LLAQTIGSGNHKKAGVYRQRGRFILIMSYTILIPFYVFSGAILKLFGQNKEVAEKTGFYVLIYSPGILMMALLDVDKILLTNLDKTKHAMGC
jgi:MATE family multidrug resistance protein